MYPQALQLLAFLPNQLAARSWQRTASQQTHKPINPSTSKLLKDFLPSLTFLGKFLFIYFVGNILYGIYVESFGSNADGITWWVSHQTAGLLDVIGYEAGTQPHPSDPKVVLMNANDSVVNMYEGCNGINIMILFIAFVVAVGGGRSKMLWFIPAGILFIHVANLARIAILYWVAQSQPDYMYFTHKYLFTASIYGAVFLLWVAWVGKVSGVYVRKRVAGVS